MRRAEEVGAHNPILRRQSQAYWGHSAVTILTLPTPPHACKSRRLPLSMQQLSTGGMNGSVGKPWGPNTGPVVACEDLQNAACSGRACARVLAPMREMSMVLVLLLRMQSGRHAFSRSAKMRCFRPTSSSTASTTCEAV